MKQRIIKFRAWDKIEKFMIDMGNLKDIEFVGRSGSRKWEQLEPMQFTGLLDKNGKEIFEGDIMTATDHVKETKNRVVKWTDQNGAYFVISNSATEKIKWDDCLTEDRIQTFGYKVIGSIYENPELLENEKMGV